MPSLHVHSTRAFAAAFRSSLAEGPKVLTIVSPFITPVPPWKSVLEFTRFVIGRGVEHVQFVTCPPVLKGGPGEKFITLAEAELLEADGVSVKIRENHLHAKFYFMGYQEPERFVAYVGSANFTLGGFERNDESVVQIQHPEDFPRVRKEVERLTGLGSFPFHAWKARNKKLGRAAV